MHIINVRNVHWGLSQAIRDLIDFGADRDSRNGPVRQMLTPVTTIYQKPMERVLFFDWRDANPFFHLIEALWMLYGSNKVDYLTPFVKNMKNFSDNGKTLHGAYGFRWKHTFGRDQLAWAINRLKADPEDRRVVIQMYDASIDQFYADNNGRDVPCNLIMIPAIQDGKLDLTVFNRSNDIIWGCYGANAVHFSFIQEILASCIGVAVGQYYQISNNFHGYYATMPQKNGQLVDHTWPLNWTTDPYGQGMVKICPVGEALGIEQITLDLKLFFELDPNERVIQWPFLRQIARPMLLAHRYWKRNLGQSRFQGALEILKQMPEKNDWRIAGEAWIMRRYDKWKLAAEDGINYGD